MRSLRRQMKIVLSVCCLYHHFIRGKGTDHAAEKLFAVDVFMRLQLGIEKNRNVHFAENQIGRGGNETS